MMAGLVDHYRAMAVYNRWMNGRLYLVCTTVDDELRKRDMGAFFGSLHATLNHLLWADRTWMLRFTGDESRFQSRDAEGNVVESAAYGPNLYSDFTALLAERKRTDRDIVAWSQELTDAKLNASFGYRNTAGQFFEHPLWCAVSHFFNHQTHHRGQITTLLKQLGLDPGITDLMVLLREQPPG